MNIPLTGSPFPIWVYLSYIRLGKKFVRLAFLHISVLTRATPGRFLVCRYVFWWKINMQIFEESMCIAQFKWKGALKKKQILPGQHNQIVGSLLSFVLLLGWIKDNFKHVLDFGRCLRQVFQLHGDSFVQPANRRKNSKSTNFDIKYRNEITKSKRCWLQWIFTWQGLAGFPYCLGPLCEPPWHLCRLSQLDPAPRKPDTSGKGLWGRWESIQGTLVRE